MQLSWLKGKRVSTDTFELTTQEMVEIISASRALTEKGWHCGAAENPFTGAGCLVTNLGRAARQHESQSRYLAQQRVEHGGRELHSPAETVIGFFEENVLSEEFKGKNLTDEMTEIYLRPLAFYNDYGGINQEDAVMLHDKALAELGAL